MPPAARIGDMHTCPMVTGVVPHVGGPIIKGEPTVLIGFMPAARIGDQLTCVGPPDVIVKGSATVLIGYMPAARMGDSTAHGGVIVVGHPTTLIGDAGGGGGGGGGGGASSGAESGGSESTPSSSDSGAIDATSIRAAMVIACRSGTALVADPPPDETAEEPKTTFALKVVIDATSDPVPGVELKITLPDGEEETHVTNGDGRIEIDDLEGPGQCSVTCDITGAKLPGTYDFVGAGAVPLQPPAGLEGGSSQPQSDERPRVIAEIEEHKVETGETLQGVATGAGLTWQELAKFNWDTEVPEEINEHLRDVVGCTKKTRDGYNYVFDSSDDPGIVFVPRQWEVGGLLTDVQHILRVRQIGGFDLLVVDEDDVPLAGKTVRVTQAGREIMTANLDVNGRTWVCGHKIGEPCEVDVEDRACFVIYGGKHGDESPVEDNLAEEEFDDVECGDGCGEFDAADDDSPSDSPEYFIVKGDTLSAIAARYGVTWRELYDYDGGTGTANSERLRSGDPDLIFPGEVIHVPG